MRVVWAIFDDDGQILAKAHHEVGELAPIRAYDVAAECCDALERAILRMPNPAREVELLRRIA